jgi:hypothetical protein
MAKRLRQFFESLVFAGLKPGGSRSQPRRLPFLGPLRGPVERFLAGGAPPSDPLYLSNRPRGQRIALGVLVGLPVALIVGGIVYVLGTGVTANPRQQAEPTAAEIARRILPDLDKNLKVSSNTDVQVVEAAVRQGPEPSVSGTVRNNTDRVIRSAELVFDLTDAAGSQVGGVGTTVRDLAPKATQRFEFPIKQHDAALVIVRETVPR